MTISSDTTYDAGERRPVNMAQIGLAIGVLAVVYIVGFALGGEVRQIMIAGLQTLPFAILALFAYLGVRQMWARVLAVIWCVMLAGLFGLMNLGSGLATFLGSAVVEPGVAPQLAEGAVPRMLAIFGLIGLSGVIGFICFVPAVRRALSRVLPLDPDSFVHTLALVTIVSVTLMCFVPLVVLGAPPLLTLVDQAATQGQDLTGGRGDQGMLRDTLYGLVWLAPAAIVAVGYGVQRTLSESLTRLGLVRPSIVQVLVAIGLAVGLVLVVQVLSLGIEWLWQTMGWQRTDTEAFGELLSFAMNPIGAVVIGITAGLGEELAVRGVLQPRLGILLSNLFFTSLHALQYSWDSLLIVFIIGMVLGVVRNRSNTTTAAIVHGVYNFLLIMASVLQIPGMAE
jgi:membrane protease YdiL (CAAX protease family)